MTIFSIILIPDFIKREHILEQYLFILDSQNMSPLQKVEFSPTNEIGSGYPCTQGANPHCFGKHDMACCKRLREKNIIHGPSGVN